MLERTSYLTAFIDYVTKANTGQALFDSGCLITNTHANLDRILKVVALVLLPLQALQPSPDLALPVR